MLLHLLNGETTETVLAQTSVPGERFSFREALIAGPAPDVNGSTWRRLRIDHLANAYGVAPEKCERDFEQQDELFDSFSAREEVVLWFESDLFCQLNLLYVLDRCARLDPGATKISLICIDGFDGRSSFRGLGELSPPELASLFAERIEVTSRQLELGARAWNAHRSADPRALEHLLQTDYSDLPFLKSALQLQLTRFPSVRHGLNRIESKGLESISNGITRFVDLFPRFSEAEAGYGLGDAQFWNALRPLAHGAQPLLVIDDGGGAATAKVPATESSWLQTTFSITDAGKAVLAGAADFVSLNGIDTWLGGVHLLGRNNIWRWDETNGRLVEM